MLGRQTFSCIRGAFSRVGRLCAPILAAATLWGQPIDPAVGLPDRHCPKLNEILAHALQQSPTMLGRNLDLAKADADQLMASAIRFPSLGGSVRYGIESVSTSNSPNTSSQGLFYNLGLGQSLFHFGSLQAGVRIGEMQKKVAERQYAEAYRDLVSGIRGQYLFLMLKKRALGLRRQTLEQAEKNFAADQVRYKEGQIATGQFAQQELAMEDERIALAKDVLEYERSKKAFMRLAGLGALDDADVPDQVPRPAWEAGTADRFVQQVLQRTDPTATPSAQVFTYLIRQSDQKYVQARARLLPKIDLSLGTSLENQTYLAADRVEQNATRRHSVGIAANWTIFDGFATRGSKRLALVERRQAERQLQTYLDTVADQRQQMVQQVELSARSLELAEKRNALQQASLPYAEEETKKGRLAPSQLSQVRTTANASDLSALAARVDFYLKWSDLVSLLWADPQLRQLPARYLAQDKSTGASLINYWPW